MENRLSVPHYSNLPAAKTYQMGEQECEVNDSDTGSNTEQTALEGSSWDDSSSSSSDSVSMQGPDETEEGELTQFLMDTFGNTETTLNDLIEL